MTQQHKNAFVFAKVDLGSSRGHTIVNQKILQLTSTLDLVHGVRNQVLAVAALPSAVLD